MGNNTKPQITIDGVTYDIETFDEQQRGLFDHFVDLDRKVNSARFQLDQLSVGRDTFLNLLKNTLVERPVVGETPASSEPQ